MPQRNNQAAQQGQQNQQFSQGMAMTGQQGGFAGAQSVMQPGFAGTDAQQVRQEIANDLNRGNYGAYSQQSGGYGGMNSGNFGGNQQAGGYQSQGGFAGAQSVMQPGFAGTDAQQVRQEIANDLNRGNYGGFTQQSSGFGGMNSGNFGGYQQAGGYQSQGGFAGAQSVMQPGFAGTDAQQVRQEIANDLNRGNYGGFTQQSSGFGGMNSGSFGGNQQAGGYQSQGGFGGVQSVMQPGFAGTDAQQVRQEIANDLNRGNSGGYTQQSGGFGGMNSGNFGGNQQAGGYQSQGGFGGVQSVMQPGFAGTDAQQVRQDIARDLNSGAQGGLQ